MNRPIAVSLQAHKVELAVVAGINLKRVIGLIGDPVGAVEALDDGRAGSCSHQNERAGESRHRLLPDLAMDEVDRLFDARARFERDDDAVAEESRIDRKRRVIRLGRDRADLLGELVAVGERAGERKDGEPRFQRLQIRKFRHEGAIHQDEPASVDTRKRIERLRRLDRAGVRRRG